MRINETNAKVTKITWFTDVVGEFTLVPANPFEFNAGQFLVINVAEKIKRCYSIASTPDSGYIKLLVDITPAGIGSKFFQNLRENDNVNVAYPYGKFVYSSKSEKDLFICTGVGIAPVLPMIQSGLEKDPNQKITLIWGIKKLNGIYWEDQILELLDKYKNFDYKIYFSRESSPLEDNYRQGRVTNFINDYKIRTSSNYYVCGNKGMITDIKRLLNDNNVKNSNIYYEQFY